MDDPTGTRTFGGAFLIPVVAFVACAGIGSDSSPTGRLAGIAGLSGVVAGAAWQVLHRRDLADRLTHFTALFSIGALGFFALSWSDQVHSSLGVGIVSGGILTGLVWTEQWFRWRTWRSSRIAVPPKSAAAVR
jgi:hypothetical protein